MLTNRGKYLALFNQHQRTILAFKEALALDAVRSGATRAHGERGETANRSTSPRFRIPLARLAPCL